VLTAGATLAVSTRMLATAETVLAFALIGVTILRLFRHDAR
jgi:hypothetical protein